MTRLRTFLAGLVLACGLVPMLNGTAYACSCAISTQTPQEEYAEGARSAEFVYVGDVVAERLEGDTMTGTRLYDVQVTQVLKGTPGPRRTLRTPANGGTCGKALNRGPVLVVGGDRVMSCGLTTQHNIPDALNWIRAGLGPVLPHTGGPGGVPVAALLAVGAALALRRRAGRA